MKQTVAIIGCTGSIGTQTMDVLSHHRDSFDLKLITCFHQIKKAKALSVSFPGVQIGVHEHLKASLFNRETLIGDDAIADWIISHQLQIVVIASSSLDTTPLLLKILPYAEKVCISSKEVIILTGCLELIKQEWKKKIIPVDSEHVAIHQLLHLTKPEYIKQVILTASGGPFYSQSPFPDLSNITPVSALKHPTWQMGKKVTIDSATLANKGIELLEAHYLFGFSSDRLNVIIHPQSIIHAMLQLKDGSVLSQMAYPDMRLPIAYSLFYPDISELPYIQPINPEAFPSCSFIQSNAMDIPIIALALKCLQDTSLKPLFYILVDEVAVDAFLNHTLRFADIPDFLEYGILELDKLYHYHDLSTFQRKVSQFIVEIKQTSQQLLLNFKKQVK